MAASEREYAVRPNKTQIKREIGEVKILCKELMKLTDKQLSSLGLSAPSLDAITEAKRLNKAALQRQLRRVVSLVHGEDVEQIQQALLRIKQPSKEQNAHQHKLEQWRERLIDGDTDLLQRIVDDHPSVDRQYLRQLIRNSSNERAKQKPPKHFRALFKYLRELTASGEKLLPDADEPPEVNN